MRIASALFPALLLSLACHHQTTGPVPEPPLDGSFDWVSSSGGLTGRELTPASVGYTVRFEYEGTRVRTFRDGQPVDDTRFSVREDLQRAGPAPVYVVTYEEPLEVFTFARLDEHTVHWAGKVILVLDEGCCDRYAHIITRRSVR